MNTFEVKWTGKYPCLCSGEWIIKKNGVDVSNKIPNEIRDNYMDTYGTYNEFHLDMETGDVICDEYDDGLDCEEWIEQNQWISNICDTHEEMVNLFCKISSQDWRHGSCGGCN